MSTLINLNDITNELLGTPPNPDNTIDPNINEDDNPIDSSQYSQEDIDYWQEEEDKKRTEKPPQSSGSSSGVNDDVNDDDERIHTTSKARGRSTQHSQTCFHPSYV